jgi:hypothetical protein
MSAKNVVEAYRKAWEAKDFGDRTNVSGRPARIRRAHRRLRQRRRLHRCDQGLSQIVTGTETKREFVDGHDVAVFYDLQTVVAAAAPIADWYRVEGDKISMIRVLFDPRPFAPPAA